MLLKLLQFLFSYNVYSLLLFWELVDKIVAIAFLLHAYPQSPELLIASVKNYVAIVSIQYFLYHLWSRLAFVNKHIVGQIEISLSFDFKTSSIASCRFRQLSQRLVSHVSLCSLHIDRHFKGASNSMSLIYVLWRQAKKLSRLSTDTDWLNCESVAG